MKYKNVNIDKKFAMDFLGKPQHEQQKLMDNLNVEQLINLSELVAEIALGNIEEIPITVKEKLNKEK